MNGQYLSSLPLEEILPEAEPFFVKSGLVTQEWLDNNKEYFAKLVDVVRVRVKTLQEVVDAAEYFFKDVESYDEKGVAKHFKPEAAELLEACIEGIVGSIVFFPDGQKVLAGKVVLTVVVRDGVSDEDVFRLDVPVAFLNGFMARFPGVSMVPVLGFRFQGGRQGLRCFRYSRNQEKQQTEKEFFHGNGAFNLFCVNKSVPVCAFLSSFSIPRR